MFNTVHLAAIPAEGKAWVRRWDIPAIVVLISLAMVGMAVLSGMVVTTNNPVLIAAIAGPLFGLLLLSHWRICFWIVVLGFLILNGPIQQFAPSLGKVTWAFSAVSLLMLALAVVHLSGFRKSEDLPVTGLAWLVLALLIYSTLSSVLISGRVGELLAGFKRYYQTFGIFFAMAVLPFALKDCRQIAKLGLLIGVLHFPLSLYQFFIVMPKSGSAGPGKYDAIVGLFEGGAQGGASGVLALYLVMMVAIFARMWIRKQIGFGMFLTAMVVFAGPLALGETKVVVVVLPFALLVAARGYLTESRSLAMLGFFGLMTVALAVRYIVLNEVNGADFGKALEDTLAYNFGSKAYDGGNFGLNRSTVLQFWWEKNGAHAPLEMFFGHGMGSSYFAENSFAPGHLFFQFPFMNINLTTVSTILWDFGIVGILMFVFLLVAAWGGLNRGIAADAGGEMSELFVYAKISLMICILSMFYNNSLVSFGSHGAVFALTLGVCAYAARFAQAKQQRLTFR
ncbi:hypothetical protein WG899_13825 [Paucibacter sp. AS339]|uniref:hypothetical protein n=1 Tax=Paucibacter hankyongi TaxID=3133434 RepID=UPI00309A09AA